MQIEFVLTFDEIISAVKSHVSSRVPKGYSINGAPGPQVVITGDKLSGIRIFATPVPDND